MDPEASPGEFGQGAAPDLGDTPGSNSPISACHSSELPGLEVAPPSQALLLPPTGQKSPKIQYISLLLALEYPFC